jgi:nucleoside recognition membrane protein YjiH
MDKFIYRGMIVLACLILAVVLIFTPVLLKMYMDTRKSEIRNERKSKDFEQRLQKLERNKDE